MTYNTKRLSANCHNMRTFASNFWTVLNKKDTLERFFFRRSPLAWRITSTKFQIQARKKPVEKKFEQTTETGASAVK